jgi:hypothetical protein
MKTRALVVVATMLAACAGREAPPPRSVVLAGHRMKLAGTITDMDFGCWADKDCGIRVDDVWIVIEGGLRGSSAPHGRLEGIDLRGGLPGEVKALYVGRAAEVFAVEVPVFDGGGNVVAYDAKRLTLSGSEDYFVRIRP